VITLAGEGSLAYRPQYRPITPGYRPVQAYDPNTDEDLLKRQGSASTKDLALIGYGIGGSMLQGKLLPSLGLAGKTALKGSVLGATVGSLAMPFTAAADATRMTRSLKNARGMDAMKTSHAQTSYIPFDYVCESWRTHGIRVAPASPLVKTSAYAPVRIHSAMQKEASINPLLREALGMNPISPVVMPPSVSIADRLQSAYGYRPARAGDMSRGTRIAAEVADIFGGALNKTEIVVNNAGIPIGKNMKFLGGPIGTAIKIPLALGGVLALNEGYKFLQKRKNNLRREKAFGQMMDVIENDPTFLDDKSRQYREMLPEQWDDVIRKGFDMAYEYAPTVARDPRAMAEYTSRLIDDVDQGGSGSEYVRRVEDLAKLENTLQRNEPSLGNLLNPAAGAMIG
jgi:hypothetical protein